MNAATANPLWTTLSQWFQATVTFFHVPANVLSVLAIVAVIVVPGIEKWLKRDEDLNAKLANLVETTNQLVTMQDESRDFSLAGNARAQVQFAQREIGLTRATELARATGDHAYPSVLLALAPILCRDGRDEDAQSFLQGILNRSSAWAS